MVLSKKRLNLTPKIADAIEAEVQQPYGEYQGKLGEYEVALLEELVGKTTLGEMSQRDLRDYQQYLGLRDEDVAPIQEPAPPVEKSNHQILIQSKKGRYLPFFGIYLNRYKQL